MTDISKKSTDMVTNNINPQIVHAQSGQLSWTHFREIIHIKDDFKRDFYAEYLTELPPIDVLEAKLHEVIRIAREQIAVREAQQ